MVKKNNHIVYSILFIKEEEKAFNKIKKDFGEVNFTCPICDGQAYSIRNPSPNNPAHNISIHGGCNNCKIYYMN